MHAFDILRQCGLRLTVEGDRLVVTPAERLDDELRAFIRDRKPELIDVVRQWERLEAAIIACCAARGDTDEHRAALLSDCLREAPDDWDYWQNYFEHEMRRWQ